MDRKSTTAKHCHGRQRPAQESLEGLAQYCETCGKRVPVLILLDGRGGVEVYGPRRLDVWIDQRLAVDTAAGYCTDEERLRKRMPQRHEAVFFPAMQRAASQCRRLTPQRALELLRKKQTDLSLLELYRCL